MNTYVVQGQPDKALAAAKAQISSSPDNADFYDLLADLLFRNKKDYEGAEAALEKSLQLSKNNIHAWIKLGQVQAASGKIDEAIATYQQAAQINPHEVNCYIALGELYEAREQWAEAAAAYQKALVVKPEEPLASGNLAYVMLQSGENSDVALSLAQTARLGLPNSSAVADTLGWAYYQKGAYPLAIDFFKRALQLQRESKSPEDPRIYYHLGMAFGKIGQSALARQELQMALKAGPSPSDAADARKQLALLVKQ
jgi:Flp pilus assembly protein TadD